MTMSKTGKKSWLLFLIGIVLLIGIGSGITYMVKHINGTTPAQIKARQEANRAADQSSEALKAQGDWYNDMMSQPVTVTNSEGETVTYEPQVSTAINSNE